MSLFLNLLRSRDKIERVNLLRRFDVLRFLQ